MTSANIAPNEIYFTLVNKRRKLCWVLALAMLAFHSMGTTQSSSSGSSSMGNATGPSAVLPAAVPVADGGKAHAVIVLGGGVGEGAKYAATELQKYLHALSGADVGIVTDAQGSSQSPQQAWILVGGPDQNGLVKQAVAKGLTGFAGLKPDGFDLGPTVLTSAPSLWRGAIMTQRRCTPSSNW